MHFVLFVIAVLLSTSALAAKDDGIMSVSRAQAAAAQGDQRAAAALSTTTDRDMCMSECASRGHSKNQYVSACRPGICHLSGEQPYCVAR